MQSEEDTNGSDGIQALHRHSMFKQSVNAQRQAGKKCVSHTPNESESRTPIHRRMGHIVGRQIAVSLAGQNIRVYSYVWPYHAQQRSRTAQRTTAVRTVCGGTYRLYSTRSCRFLHRYLHHFRISEMILRGCAA